MLSFLILIILHTVEFLEASFLFQSSISFRVVVIYICLFQQHFFASYVLWKKKVILVFLVSLCQLQSVPRSCKRSDTLFQKSLLVLSIWREQFYSQPNLFSNQPKIKDVNKVLLLLQDLESVHYYSQILSKLECIFGGLM